MDGVKPSLHAPLVLAVLALLPASASAAVPTPIEPLDLGEWRAKGEVVDTRLRPTVRAKAAAAHVERFSDEHGHVLTLVTDLPGLDLNPYARVFAALHHDKEIEDVVIEVVAPDEIPEICGDPEALACYAPEDPARSLRGWIWIPTADPDLIHIIVHEYGHHVDNQLINLGHLGIGCGFNDDGSRNWFFERDVDDRLLDNGVTCSPERGWSHLLGELYAEDYTWLNGNRYWRPDMPVRAPADWHLSAMASDFADPLDPETSRYGGWVGHRKSRWTRVENEDWTVFTARLRGRRAADLDLFLYRAGKRRPFAASRGQGSGEEIGEILAPGRYDVQVLARRDGGNARLRLFFD